MAAGKSCRSAGPAGGEARPWADKLVCRGTLERAGETLSSEAAAFASRVSAALRADQDRAAAHADRAMGERVRKRSATLALQKGGAVARMQAAAGERAAWDRAASAAAAAAGSRRRSFRVSLAAAQPPPPPDPVVVPAKFKYAANPLRLHARDCRHYLPEAGLAGCTCCGELKEAGHRARFWACQNATPSLAEMTVSADVLPWPCASTVYLPPPGHDGPPAWPDSVLESPRPATPPPSPRRAAPFWHAAPAQRERGARV